MLDYNKYTKDSSNFNITKEGYEKCKDRISNYVEMLHHCIGIVTENAELLDALKKHIYYNKDIDIPNLVEEVGDIHWYAGQLLTLTAELAGITPQEVLAINTRKLSKRYPDKFSEDSAINRDLEEERAVLEDGVSN